MLFFLTVNIFYKLEDRRLLVLARVQRLRLIRAEQTALIGRSSKPRRCLRSKPFIKSIQTQPLIFDSACLFLVWSLNCLHTETTPEQRFYNEVQGPQTWQQRHAKDCFRVPKTPKYLVPERVLSATNNTEEMGASASKMNLIKLSAIMCPPPSNCSFFSPTSSKDSRDVSPLTPPLTLCLLGRRHQRLLRFGIGTIGSAPGRHGSFIVCYWMFALKCWW